MLWAGENYRFYFKLAILLSLLFHVMFFYAHFPGFKRKSEFQSKKMRIIKVHSLPITTKKVEEKIDLKPIPARYRKRLS